MFESASTPVLHHYKISPFSEKVRLVLGYKGLAWRSVSVPNILPKPDVLALTGGYRKTPFLQDSLKLTPKHARMASPALWQRPKKGVLYTVAGGDESAEFLRHNRLIHQTWGPKTVPVCEDLTGLNHFSIVTDLTKKGTRLSALMKQLLQA